MEDIESTLLEILSDGEWHTEKELKARGFTREAIRQTELHLSGQIIGHPNGYKLTKYATKDEVRHTVNWLRKMAHNILERANTIQAAAGAA